MTHTKWPMVRLQELVTKSEEKVPVEADRNYPNFGIYNFGRGLFGKPPISGASSSAKSLYRAKANQFVYSRLFAFEGAYGLVTPELDGHFVSNEFPLFDCDESRLLPSYLGWYFQCSSTWRQVAQLTTGMGNRRQRIKPEAILGHAIPVPPLASQRRIAEKLDRVKSRLEEASKTAAEANRLRLAMMRSIFSEIVDGAEARPLDSVAPLVRRKAEPRSGSRYPELGVRSFGKGTFHKPALDFMSVGSKKLYRIEAGDLVFSNVFAWEGAVAVAKKIDHGRFGSHRFITCVPNQDVATAEFLCFYFLTPGGIRKIGEASPGGAGRNRTLGLKKLGLIEVPVPHIDAQKRFGSLLQRTRHIESERIVAEKQLDAVLPSILDRAFKGEL